MEAIFIKICLGAVLGVVWCFFNNIGIFDNFKPILWNKIIRLDTVRYQVFFYAHWGRAHWGRKKCA